MNPARRAPLDRMDCRRLADRACRAAFAGRARLVTGAVVAALAAEARSQQLPDLVTSDGGWPGQGWTGFTDFAFLFNALLTLALAAVLGIAIGYHPHHQRAADTLEKIDAPKVYTMYAVIGAVIGIMVLKYGLVVGFVVFGIGGLIRFRTDLRSAMLTGQVILVTLIGLSCGLNLPHVAVLTTVFGFVLIYFLEAKATYRIDVKALPAGCVAEAAAAYRALLEQQGCRIVSEKKSPLKQRVSFIFHCRHATTRQRLEELFETAIDRTLRGTVDWEID